MKTTIAVLLAFTLFSAATTYAAIGNQLAKLTANDGAAGDWFGSSVAISGETALVGADGDDDSAASSGSAYLFDVATGNQLAKLTASDGAAYDRFGWSVAISGETALVGACYDDDNGQSSGSAYLFDVTTGVQLSKLTPSDGATEDGFGFSVAISGATALVGAWGDDDNGTDSGSAYLFDVSTGDQLAKLTPSDAAAWDNFGRCVAISGQTAIIGAALDRDNGTGSGSAYLFDVATGDQLAKLTPSDGAAFDRFGWSVAISGETALVGAYYDDDKGTDSGSAYLFDVATGDQLAKLTPNDGAANDWFGRYVAISGETALVGAYYDDDKGTDSGSAYLFNVATGNQLAKLTATDGANDDLFGSSVAISGEIALVAAVRDDDNGSSSGSAYLFSAIPEPTTLLMSTLASMTLLGSRASLR